MYKAVTITRITTITFIMACTIVMLAIISFNNLSFSRLVYPNLTETKDIALDLFNVDGNTLILLANNAEQRYGGGFIGSVGLLKNNGSEIEFSGVKSVYFYDWVFNESEMAPVSVVDNIQPDIYAGQQVLRNSGIFLNWPDNAKLASTLFENNTGIKVNNVIQITPDVLLDLLELTGGIYLEKYNLIADKNNFRTEIQAEVEGGQDKAQGKDPKSILNEIAKGVLFEIADQSVYTKIEFIDVLMNQLEKRNIVLYSDSPKIQNNILSSNFGGKLISTSSNYLSFSELSYSSNKASPYIERSAKLNLSFVDDRGEAYLKNKLSITREHTSDYAFEYTDPIDNKTRYLVDHNIAYQSIAINSTDELAYSDELLNLIEYEELDKKVYKFYMKTLPLSTSNLEVEYISKNKSYNTDTDFELDYVLQKLPGQFPVNIDIEVEKIPFSVLTEVLVNGNKYEIVDEGDIYRLNLMLDKDYTINFKFDNLIN